ncbi:MAG: hypothetical protein P8Q36_20145 [Alphaproteobacteria bacterium]|nr:hypothetical protein [Rhodospirillaceae bacterium]MDG2483155.1 hypothetical protein [Alphaproteobacteria bacterium]MBT6204263.1 hypothetical protein [Rhodospirillaceae bacterium]MBT6509846.1 hypothetical protein [Rhodospirillaceae bacterium]MBT7613550.1 hypothetical protein [Rhodospirillaceae bacterium]
MFTTHPVTECSEQQLCEAMIDAFSDYQLPLNLTLRSFQFMMVQRGLDLNASRVAVVDGSVAAIWLVAVRERNAYLISSGTRPRFRSKGLG